MALRVGADIGGTFTDLVVFDDSSQTLQGFKTPTIRDAPERGIVEGLRDLSALDLVKADEIAYLVHGSTIATNTLLQRSGARLSLLVTEGFRDVLELARIRLPDPFNLNSDRPTPLVPRERVLPVRERILADGSVAIPLDTASAQQALQAAGEAQVDGIVVSFINSYRNATHEAEVKRLARATTASIPVSCSYEVWPEIREYERTLVTLINAYVRPRVVGYLGRLQDELRRAGVTVSPFVTKSNGGVMSVSRAIERPVEMLVSGPAAGVLGAARVAGMAGLSDLITFDVGGTSADVAVIRRGQPEDSTDAHIGDFPVILPVVGVSSVGAGGGSIAWCDQQGVLHVGPQSAGADPGPACYGRGGEESTLTDAFLVNGLLDPATFCGGRVPLRPELAEAAVARLSRQLHLSSLHQTAAAIIRVATATMVAEFSGLMSKKGLDPREFTLVPFGGAGPLLAGELAREFHIGQVLVPLEPGTLCAMGALLADIRNDYVASLHTALKEASAVDLRAVYESLRRSATEAMRDEEQGVAEWVLEYSADMRYVGQAYEIAVVIHEDDVREGGLAALTGRFHAEHRRVYGHADEEAAVELVTARARLTGRRAGPAPRPTPSAGGSVATGGRRTVQVNGARMEVRVLLRGHLRPGQRVRGPAIVEQADTTVLVPAGSLGIVDTLGNILIREDR